jgi:hypothetical protein
MEAKVLMDKEGNIKYPIYKSYAETTNFQNIGQFTELIKSDPEGYYLDDASLEHLKRTFVIGFGPDTADNDYWRKLMEMYPNDPRVKQIAIDKIISIQKEGKEVYYGENLPAGWISFGGPEKDSIPLALTLFKNYPDLQKSYLESITLTIKDKEYDANLLLHSAKASSNGVVFKTLLDKYGPKLKEEDYLNWQATYQIYHGFSSYFPDYNEIGLTDIQKLQFVKEEVFKSGYGSNPIVALPIKEIQQSINNYVGGDHKNKVLFDSSYDLYSYNYPTNNAGGSSSNFAVLPATLNQKNTFNKEVIRDVDKDGFSLTSRIKQDLADPNPDAKKIYVFNNHGGPNTQYVGMKFYLWSIELSDSDIADSLLKGYMASSKNPNKRTFGNKVMVFESCYSGDFIENTNNKLQDLLAKKGVNPNNVKLPTFISVTDKGKVGFTGSDGKNSIMLRLANQMNEENKNITLQRFLEERNKLFNEQYYNNPQILTSYN